MASPERTLAMLEGRLAWPLYPLLPMKNVPGDGSAKLGKINIADTLVIDIDGEGCKRFPSFEAIIGAGWRVD